MTKKRRPCSNQQDNFTRPIPEGWSDQWCSLLTNKAMVNLSNPFFVNNRPGTPDEYLNFLVRDSKREVRPMPGGAITQRPADPDEDAINAERLDFARKFLNDAMWPLRLACALLLDNPDWNAFFYAYKGSGVELAVFDSHPIMAKVQNAIAEFESSGGKSGLKAVLVNDIYFVQPTNFLIWAQQAGLDGPIPQEIKDAVAVTTPPAPSNTGAKKNRAIAEQRRLEMVSAARWCLQHRRDSCFNQHGRITGESLLNVMTINADRCFESCDQPPLKGDRGRKFCSKFLKDNPNLVSNP